MDEKYLSTNELAKIFKVNRQTLYFYDNKGLFKPEERGLENNYRKYSPNQILTLALIRYLRRVGFSIDEIKEVMNTSSLEFTILKLKKQSSFLKRKYEELLEMDEVIQRKVEFVEDRLRFMEIGEYKRCTYGQRSYLYLGEERILYKKDIFYFYPTLVFYNYDPSTKAYGKYFGAYIQDIDPIPQDFKDRLKQIEKKEYLCYFHKGAFKNIPQTVNRARQDWSELNLSNDFICINVVDQFLEKDDKNFITEVQIPILE